MSRYVAVERLHFAHGVICLDLARGKATLEGIGL